jgi:uncharacterized protein (DUF2147 family)
MIRFLVASAAALLAAGTIAQSAAPPAPQEGHWITETGNLEVQVAPCGAALCGTVTRVLANRSMAAPGTAMQAADPRPALGLVILSDFAASGDGAWQGRIYNRENGKHYSAVMTMAGADQLVLRAYVGLPLFGKTQVWRRAGTGSGTSDTATGTGTGTTTGTAP